ncbi:ArsR/SmtB family transcription factor [Culicoidibacter larvae]|uniref:Winged helix-turn-helix transcriptional regulator n=1 Tax=Culicoidibacter larvae TaxID=2579976 RepID=A0A5R8QGJ4_9FIRM|nr:ArsR family transcriptional regulator [Culicoidibacter larvae]TLG77092.1 winged helix-turn-helix transcriptional regulator [Culicoidibacter larvae]
MKLQYHQPHLEYETVQFLTKFYLAEKRSSPSNYTQDMSVLSQEIEQTILELGNQLKAILVKNTLIQNLFIEIKNYETIADILFFINYIDQKNENKDALFRMHIYEVLNGEEPSGAITPEVFFDVLHHSEIADEIKWKITDTHNNITMLSEKFISFLDELKPTVAEAISKYQPAATTHLHSWESLGDDNIVLDTIKETLHLDLSSTKTEPINFYPSIIGYHKISLVCGNLFIGLIFTSEFSFHSDFTLDELAKYLKFFGDSSKLAIIMHLKSGAKYGKELADLLQLTPATISYHINELVGSGMVFILPSANKRIYYELNTELMNAIVESLQEQIKA